MAQRPFFMDAGIRVGDWVIYQDSAGDLQVAPANVVNLPQKPFVVDKGFSMGQFAWYQVDDDLKMSEDDSGLSQRPFIVDAGVRVGDWIIHVNTDAVIEVALASSVSALQSGVLSSTDSAGAGDVNTITGGEGFATGYASTEWQTAADSATGNPRIIINVHVPTLDSDWATALDNWEVGDTLVLKTPAQFEDTVLTTTGGISSTVDGDYKQYFFDVDAAHSNSVYVYKVEHTPIADPTYAVSVRVGSTPVTSVSEGFTYNVRVDTTNVADNTTLYIQLYKTYWTGALPADDEHSSDWTLGGTENSFVQPVVITNNIGSAIITFTADETTELGDERVKVTLRSALAVADGEELATTSWLPINDISQTPAAPADGANVYGTPGTYTWTVPAGVTSISAVAVGAGGGAYTQWNYEANRVRAASAGQGGSLSYANNISVTPGEVLTVVAGAGGDSATGSGGWYSNYTPRAVAGGSSYIARADGTVILRAKGGNAWGNTAGTNSDTNIGDVSHTGGSGGGTPPATNGGPGGGGAAGYAGSGGSGRTESIYGNAPSTAAPADSGGASGGYGGGGKTSNGKGGGGVGLYGLGDTATGNGQGGSGGTNYDGFNGGTYGGGAAGGQGAGSGEGGPGGVRIVWSAGAAFPSTNVAEGDNETVFGAQPTYAIDIMDSGSSATSLVEGNSYTIQVTTTNVADGTVLYVQMLQTSDLYDPHRGDFSHEGDSTLQTMFVKPVTITNNSGSTSLDITADYVDESANWEGLRATLRTHEVYADGTELARSSNLQIIDV